MTHMLRTITTFLAVLTVSLAIPSSRLTAQGRGQDWPPVRDSAGPPARSSGLYIVQMAELPVSSYTGGVAGLASTRPQRGSRVEASDPNVAGYARYLDGRHDEALARARGGRKVYSYRYVFNGFAAELDEVQAEALKATPGVLRVTKDVLWSMDTSSTPAFLGMSGFLGLWQQSGGVDDAGEDVVVGVIDSGIWPENDSFSDRPGRNRRPYKRLRNWLGTCVAGEQFTEANCNRKVIGARHYNAAWGGDEAIAAEMPWEFTSPRDYNGHGSHTASTAAGNHDVALTGDAKIFGRISGMAPRARIAVYKALWSLEDGSEANGFTSDLVAAIDQAVADGVDVINYSVSGTQTNLLDPVELAFMFAADAGVFVSASAGNSGPTASTVAHPSPWITTVAAGTHNRNGEGSVTLGNGATYEGPSLANAVGPAPLINSTAAALAGADPTLAAHCYSRGDNGGAAVLDPAKVAGKIVVCDRGVTGRTSKSQAVLEAGGVGMILVNTSENSLNADFHFVPTVHLSHLDRPAIQAYAATAGATARIARATIVFDTPAPYTAAFSSRGPLRAAAGDLLKPDITAPGQDIVAAVAPPANNGRLYDVYSGTSMSAPHIAGIAAVLKGIHRSWSPMAIKSAMMTTAGDVLDGSNTNPAVIFSQGAGHVTPRRATFPGLVFDSDINDWLALLCGTTNGVNPATCNALAGAGYSLDPSDMNVPSVAIGDLAGTQVVTRTVTNVGWLRTTYRPTVTGMEGVTVKVTPSVLRIAPGRSATFTITFTRTTAPLNAYTGGQLTFTDGLHRVRIPLAVRPVPLAAPAEVFSAGEPIAYNVTFGYTGAFSAAARGLVAATTHDAVVEDDPTDTFVPGGPGTTSFPITVQPGTTLARFSTFDANMSPASDVDLWVFRGATLVGISAGGTSEEEVTLVNPPPGNYTVYVHGYAVPGSASFTLFDWAVGTEAAGNMTVTAPAAATGGTTASIGLTFNGLTPGMKYLGTVAYDGAAGLPPPTVVRVEP